MSVLATAGKVVTGAVVGSGIALAVMWSGQPHLEAVQEKAQNYVNKVEEMKAEYEAVISDKQIEIQDIRGMYYAMEEKVAELSAEKEEIEKMYNELINGSSNQNGYIAEIEKANSDVKIHKQTMDEILDESIFE